MLTTRWQHFLSYKYFLSSEATSQYVSILERRLMMTSHVQNFSFKRGNPIDYKIISPESQKVPVHE